MYGAAKEAIYSHNARSQLGDPMPTARDTPELQLLIERFGALLSDLSHHASRIDGVVMRLTGSSESKSAGPDAPRPVGGVLYEINSRLESLSSFASRVDALAASLENIA